MTQSNSIRDSNTSTPTSLLNTIQPHPGNRALNCFIKPYRKLRSLPPQNKSIFNGITKKIEDADWHHTTTHTQEISDSPLDGELLKIFDGHENFPFLSIYVHGSWADNSRTAFSDLDDFIIIDEEAIPNKQAALAARNWLNLVDMRFCRIDPLQHHGHWFTSRRSLERYDQAVMPIEAIEGAIRIQGPDKIHTRHSKSTTQKSLHRNIAGTIHHLEFLSKKVSSGSINFYEMKEYIGMILILPAYIAQATGQRLNKKQAIEQAHQLFSTEAGQAIHYASETRNDWDRLLDPHLNRLHTYARFFRNPHVHRFFAKKAAPRFDKETLEKAPLPNIDQLAKESQNVLHQ